MKVSVVILNWNGLRFLKDFLHIVVKNLPPYADIVIGDNASTDGSVEYIRANYPEIKIIANDKNYGFAGGYNKVLSQLDADYFVILNSDIEVTPNWIEPIIKLMEHDSSVAAVQPKIMSYYDKTQFEYAGAAGGYIDFLGYPFCRGRIFDTIENDKGQYDDVCKIFWATGAAMFVKASVYKELGGFDDLFFAHQEEIDLCWRMQNNGYKILYCPSSTIYHIGGGTLPKSSPRKDFLNFRNNLFMMYKNMSTGYFILIFIMRFFLDMLAMFKLFISSGFRHGTAVIEAYIDFFKNIKKLKKSRTNNEISTIYQYPILWSYYALDKKTFSDLKK